MPEGHTLHRLAAGLRERFAGEQVAVSSPQGRFADAAALLDGTVLVDAQSWGKHLFVEFAGDRFVHIHLGLIGKLELGTGPAPAPVGQVRLRIGSSETAGCPSYADLRGATTCDLVTREERQHVLDRLGPDPLRADADPGRAWERIRGSRAPIGALLMDQTVLAGVGNVYRAEVLFRHRMHPLRPGNTLRRRQFDALWSDLVALMHEGVEKGRIDTVREEHTPEAMQRPPRVDDHGGEVYVYRRQGQACHVCGSTVRTEVLGGRNLFWCARCQPRFRSRAGVR
ncbi:MAG TPA: DNA-formamidopyrimidine glycosylase family protein [Nocardioidaceae bacterium]|jgi:endonuclease-8